MLGGTSLACLVDVRKPSPENTQSLYSSWASGFLPIYSGYSPCFKSTRAYTRTGSCSVVCCTTVSKCTRPSTIFCGGQNRSHCSIFGVKLWQGMAEPAISRGGSIGVWVHVPRSDNSLVHRLCAQIPQSFRQKEQWRHDGMTRNTHHTTPTT
jgi:hypothetical protein